MARRLIWAAEKVRGVPQKRATCSRCGWISEIRGIRGGLIYQKQNRKGIPANTTAIRLEFLNHKRGISGRNSQVEQLAL